MVLCTRIEVALPQDRLINRMNIPSHFSDDRVGTLVRTERGYYRLTLEDCYRFKERERKARLRAKRKGATVIEAVDFLGVCVKQNWSCCLCHKPMDPTIRNESNWKLTLEHTPSLFQGRDHSERTVGASHRYCNNKKEVLRQREERIAQQRAAGLLIRTRTRPRY